jgi:ActR/RegA family two-component response regulator
MARVIGRTDLAEEVHRVLAESGIGANLYNGTPMDAGIGSGSGMDIVVLSDDLSGLQTCGNIKDAAPRRPVLAVTPARLAAAVEAMSAGARGPDAYVVWPASGEALRAAMARAVDAARTRRPRSTPRLMWAAGIAMLVLAIAALAIAIW